ncbi:MAG: exonuclease domain-containing protein [Cytophagaceae bacterium]|jgi:inhibitor of KinA sporulation pathway (predicted exonuclease)|nr:exonuclease domain-containing protein [Cytophagaceae bacterium]
MKYIIVDLEATCWEEKHSFPQEVIEIGAVKINKQNSITSEFVSFVKPVRHPLLSNFCRQLTSIEQSQVDQAPLFPEAIHAFRQWITQEEDEYILCSWGFYDRKQLHAECCFHGLDAEWLSPHISLKHRYAEIKQLNRPVGMKTALTMEGLPLVGTHHRGIDDARNIAQVFLKNQGAWKY